MQIDDNGKMIKHVRGDSGAITIGSIKVGGETVTGATAILSVKKNITDTTYALQITANSDNAFVFTPNNTKNLQEGLYCYDIQITLADGSVYTPIVGGFMLLPDVTRS